MKQRGDWLGETYDYVDKTVELAEKTRKKVRDCLDSDKRTFKNIAAIFAILQYASRTLNHPLSAYFQALRAQSDIGRLLQEVPELWNATCPVFSPSLEATLRRWRDDLLNCRPRRVHPGEMPTAFLICDSSSDGWGAAFVSPCGGTNWAVGGWTDADYAQNIPGHSARAEPVGIARALMKFLMPTGPPVRLVIATDSMTAKFVMAAGFSKSYFVNAVINELNVHFQHREVDIRAFHLAGEAMPVDGISRGNRYITTEEWERIEELGRCAREHDDFIGVETKRHPESGQKYMLAYGGSGVDPDDHWFLPLQSYQPSDPLRQLATG